MGLHFRGVANILKRLSWKKRSYLSGIAVLKMFNPVPSEARVRVAKGGDHYFRMCPFSLTGDEQDGSQTDGEPGQVPQALIGKIGYDRPGFFKYDRSSAFMKYPAPSGIEDLK